MIEYENSKSDDQLEELLLLTEQMQEELDQKDRTIEELRVQLDESLTLNERLNSENRAGNIQALKNDLRKTKELLQSEKEKTHAAEIMTEECQDKLRQAEQERDYALSHQKKVEIPVEKPVLYQKCGNCKQTAYLKAKERYDTQREKLAGRYKAKTAIYEALMFLLIWYSVSTTLFQMIRSKIFICNGVQREHNKKLNNGLPILHKVPPKRDYGRYFCIMAEKGGTSHGGLTEKLSLFFHAKKQEVNAYGR